MTPDQWIAIGGAIASVLSTVGAAWFAWHFAKRDSYRVARFAALTKVWRDLCAAKFTFVQKNAAFELQREARERGQKDPYDQTILVDLSQRATDARTELASDELLIASAFGQEGVELASRVHAVLRVLAGHGWKTGEEASQAMEDCFNGAGEIVFALVRKLVGEKKRSVDLPNQALSSNGATRHDRGTMRAG